MSDATADPQPPNPAAARGGAGTAAAATHLPAVAPVPELPLQPLVTIAVVAFSGLLIITAFAGPVLVALAVALGAGVISWGWSGLLGLPSPRGSASVVALGSTAAIGTTLATLQDPFLAWMPAALAGSLIVAFLHQLARRDGRPRLVESVASNVMAIVIVVSGASLVVLPRTMHGAAVVAVAFSALAVSTLADLAGGPPRLRASLLPLAMLVGGIVAIVVGHLLGVVSWGAAALLGVSAAGVGQAVRRALAVEPAISSARSQLVSASASVLTAGMVVYVVGRLFSY